MPLESPVRPLWHDRASTPGRTPVVPPRRARRILLVTALLLTALASAAGLLTWFAGTPRVHFVSCWVTMFQDPTIRPNTAADHDRRAIQRGGYFSLMDVASMPVHSRFLMQQQLESLARVGGPDNVVLYTATYATIDGDGKVVLLSSDYQAAEPDRGLSLALVLKSLQQCPADNKLLVLDLLSHCGRPGLEAAAMRVSSSLEQELAAVPDTHRLVLCSCSPGQQALESETLHRTVFGYYFEQALRGAADGYNPAAIRDGRVSVRELAAMLRARVDRWALHARGQRQIPVLHGTANDFDLAIYDASQRVAPPTKNKLPKYPVWLRDAWNLRDQWEAKGTDHLSPRTYQTLQASLLRMERKWRFGDPEPALKSQCAQTIQDLQQQLALSTQQLSGPPPPSLAALVVAGQQPDETVTQAVSTLLAALQTVTDPKQRQAEFTKQLAAFDKQTAKIADVDIAIAVLQAANTGDPLTADRVQLLAQLLDHRHLNDQWIEPRTLGRLANQADQIPAAAWSTHRASQLQRMVCRREQLASHFESMPWMHGLLESTAQACHDADVLYWSNGFVPADAVDSALASANTACDVALAHQAVLVDAQHTYQQALGTLPWVARYVARVPGSAAQWTAAIDDTSALSQLLLGMAHDTDSVLDQTSPGSTLPPAPPGLPTRQLDALQTANTNATHSLQLLQLPFTTGSVRALVRRCRDDDARPAVLDEADAILDTPLLRAADRVALWTARAALARRLGNDILEGDYREDRSHRPTQALAGYDPDAALRSEANLASLRYSVTVDLLRLAGMSLPPTLSPDDSHQGTTPSVAQLTELSRVWAVTLRDAIDGASSPARKDSLSRIFPPLKPLPLLDNPGSNPTVQLLAQHRRQLWAWLADRYRYETLDGSDPEFYASWAVQYASYQDGSHGPTLQTTGPSRLATTAREATPVVCDIDWAANMAKDRQLPVHIDLFNPAAPWLEVTAGNTGNRDASAQSPLQLSLSLSGHAEFSGQVPQGILARWRIGLRTFHRPLAVPDLQNQQTLNLVLSINAQGATQPLDQIVLRPHVPSAPLYLYVRNNGAQTRKVFVQLSGGARSGVVDVAAGQTAKMQFAPPVPPPKDTTAADAPPAEISGPLRATLVDAQSQQTLCERLFPIVLMEPRQYVKVRTAQFKPVDDEQNRLVVELEAAGDIPGPNCPVALEASPATIPGLVSIGDSKLQGTLSTDQQSLRLFISDLHLADSVQDRGRFSISVDGVDRAFVFDTTFARGGDPTTPVEVIRPALRMTAPEAGKSGGPCLVHIETDCAPHNAWLELEIGRQVDAGKFVADRTLRLPSARHRQVQLQVGEKGGALTVQGSLSDWNVALDTAGLVGARIIQTKLVADAGGELVRTRQNIMLGNEPPQGVQFVDLPATAYNGQPLRVVATSRKSVPEVNQVLFFLGKPQDNAIPKDAQTVPGTLDPSTRSWQAQLPLKPEMTGQVNISVQFTSGAGLYTIQTAAIQLTNTPVGGGSIVGTVVEGTIRQPGLEVVLLDEHGTAQQKTTSNGDGSFRFQNLKPGRYEVTTSKPASGRHGQTTVTVQDQTTVRTTVELWL